MTGPAEALPVARRRRAVLRGLTAATVTVLIVAAWPVMMRLGITRQALSPLQLTTLRYAISGLLFLPLLPILCRGLDARAWREGLVLSILQGAPLAMLIGEGLRYAPAAHASALTLGLLPVFTLLLQAALGERPSRRAIGGAAIVALGGAALATAHIVGGGKAVAGHALFILAALMGAGYFVRLRRSGLTSWQGAAFVAVFSGFGATLALLWTGGLDGIVALCSAGLATQALFQGVLVGAVALVTVNRVVALLGAAAATLSLALVPVVAAVLGLLVLGEVPLLAELAAMGAMVVGAALSLAPHGGAVRRAIPWRRALCRLGLRFGLSPSPAPPAPGGKAAMTAGAGAQ
ncbi:EamA family transporter [Muricoccus radiodurans]|uniref:EamA family transporter n=1 Tax=Muricoccus radiodurans TaxID=2231721 RepID=UPI003CEF7FE4